MRVVFPAPPGPVMPMTGVCLCSRETPAAAEDADVLGAGLAQGSDHLAEKLDVPPVVAADADASDALLDCGAHDIAHRAVEAEVDHLKAMAHEFQVDGGDGRIMPIADGHGRQEADAVVVLLVRHVDFA